MAKDKRVKGCPNTYCDRNLKHYKYKSIENFCSLCGTNLVFVCANCFGPLEDSADKHRLCARCEAEVAAAGGKVGHAIKSAGKDAAVAVKDGAGVVILGAEKGAKYVADVAPIVVSKAKSVAQNPVARKTALAAAEVLKDEIKNGKVKKVVKAAINAAQDEE